MYFFAGFLKASPSAHTCMWYLIYANSFLVNKRIIVWLPLEPWCQEIQAVNHVTPWRAAGIGSGQLWPKRSASPQHSHPRWEHTHIRILLPPSSSSPCPASFIFFLRLAFSLPLSILGCVSWSRRSSSSSSRSIHGLSLSSDRQLGFPPPLLSSLFFLFLVFFLR